MIQAPPGYEEALHELVEMGLVIETEAGVSLNPLFSVKKYDSQIILETEQFSILLENGEAYLVNARSR